MKRILAVIPSLSMGGAEKAFILWVEELRKLGFTLIVATTQPQNDFFNLPKDILRYKKKNLFKCSRFYNLFSRIWEPFSNASFLKKIIRSNQIDIVISHLPKSNIPAILASSSEKVPCIIMEHLYQEKLKDPILNFLRKSTYTKARALVVLTPAMRNLFKPYNVNIVEIANPISSPSLILPFKKKEPIILLVGRLTSQKQYIKFISELYQLSLHEWKIWIVGEGEERSSLEESIIKNNLQEKVILWGSQKDMEPFYQEASIFVLCSKREGLPLVLAEAALYGCSRVSFNCPTGPEIMIKNGLNGFLVEDQNWKELMEKIQFLIDNTKKREFIYTNSLAFQSTFTPGIVALKWQNLIDKVSS